MGTDIKFDVEIFDCPLVDGDFQLEANCSTQNGGNLLYSQCAILTNPIWGVGINQEIMNNDPTFAAEQMNRWKKQVNSDGGQANWQSIPVKNKTFEFTVNVNYQR